MLAGVEDCSRDTAPQDELLHFLDRLPRYQRLPSCWLLASLNDSTASLLAVNHLHDMLLDVLGSQPSLFKLYTQIAFVFAIDDGASDLDQVASALRRGLDSLAAQLPWLRGNVRNENSKPGCSGSYRIVESTEIPLVVADLRKTSSTVTLNALQGAQYPFSLLDESLIAPCMTLNLPGSKIGLVAETGPVLALQASFITGGLILTVAAQHNVMDMAGMAAVVTWLSKACNGTGLSDEELAIANIDKSKILTLHDGTWGPNEAWLERLQAKPAAPSSSPMVAPNVCWGYVAFSTESIAALKRFATETKDADSTYISSDDAVCAFIWKHLSRARTARMEAKSTTVFARAVDLRSRMGVPSTYLGTLTNMAYNESSLGSFSKAPLGQIAAELRSQLHSPKLSEDTRALATVLDRLHDKSVINITAPVDPSTGIMLSSWAFAKLDQLDFGMGLGMPLAVRRPAFTPVESLMYIMPKSPSHGAVVGMCLREEDWTQLEQDSGWIEHAMYLG